MRPLPIRVEGDEHQAALDRGIPLGPMVGHSYDRDQFPPQGKPLFLLTGTLDDLRTPAAPGTPLYGMAVYAFMHRDLWCSSETRDYWESHLFAWPTKGVRPGFVETTTFLAAVGLNYGFSADEVYRSFWPLDEAEPLRSKKTLQNKKVMERAERHRHELMAVESGLSLPRVLTHEEYEHRETLLTGQPGDESPLPGLWGFRQSIPDERRDVDHGAPVHDQAEVLMRKVLREQHRMLSDRADQARP